MEDIDRTICSLRLRNLIWKIIKAKKDWGRDSNCRAPAWIANIQTWVQIQVPFPILPPQKKERKWKYGGFVSNDPCNGNYWLIPNANDILSHTVFVFEPSDTGVFCLVETRHSTILSTNREILLLFSLKLFKFF
jgi:hypothetical protein